MNDLRFALRQLFRHRSYTVIAVLTLALGIGVNSAVFSLVNTVVLRDLPYPEPGRIVWVREYEPREGNDRAVAPPAFFDWREQARLFSAIAAVSPGWFNLIGREEPARIEGAFVTAQFGEAIGVSPALGSWFTSAEEIEGAGSVAVLSDQLWRSRFGADPEVIGRTVTLTDQSYVVVGVMPPGFSYPGESQVWVPLAIPPEERAPDQRLSHYLGVVARLAPGVSPEAAEAELDRVSLGMAERYPLLESPLESVVTPLRDSIVGETRTPLFILLGAVGFVLLVAALNVANLQLAHTANRSREVAVRTALGAGRGRIARLLIAQSLLIALAGAVLGLVLAWWGRDLLLALAPADLPRIAELGVDLRVFGFALAVATLAGLISGLVPALAATRDDVTRTLKADSRSTLAPHRLRGALIAGELALSVLLLAGAGVMIRSLGRLVSVDPGFEARGVLTMEITLPRSRYRDPAEQARLFDEVLAGVRAVPGVENAGATTNLPLSRTDMMFGFQVQGRESAGEPETLPARFRAVSPGYFATLGVPVLRGRGLTRADDADAPRVMLINQAMARRYWPGQDPRGSRIAITRGRGVVWREIVGIVGDARHASLRSEAEPEMYAPFLQEPFFFMRVVARSRADQQTLADGMRRAVWRVDPDQPVAAIRPLTELVGAHLAPIRLQAVLLGAFAGLALLLAAIGLYGVIAFAVSQRTREIGVRVALGAGRRDIMRLVVGGSARLVALGGLIGLAGALGATRVLRRLLFETSPSDPLTLAAVILLLFAVGLFASWLPAARATRIDPMEALRHE